MILKLDIQGPVLKNNEKNKNHPPPKKPEHGIVQTLDLEIL